LFKAAIAADALEMRSRAEPVKLAPGTVENCALCLETLFFQWGG
jgi:hypothetical protein